jgi:hypothetical protein
MLLKSFGLKRKVVGYLVILIEVLRQVPGAEAAVIALEQLVGALGGVAVGHAAAQGTVAEKKLLSISSVLSFLVLASRFIPSLAAYTDVLQEAATIFAAGGLGAAYGASSKQSLAIVKKKKR